MALAEERTESITGSALPVDHCHAVVPPFAIEADDAGEEEGSGGGGKGGGGSGGRGKRVAAPRATAEYER